MVYGLIFLANTALTPQEQRDAIVGYAQKHGIEIDEFISYDKQPDVTLFKPGDSAVLYAWNCICRKKSILNDCILHFLKNQICIYSVTSAYSVDGTKDFAQIEFAFNLCEDIRFNFTSARNADGIKTRMANGNAPGRHKGTRNKRHVLDGKGSAILKMYSDGASMYAIAKKMKVSAPTIKRFLTTQK